jgi:hypothetical protein
MYLLVLVFDIAGLTVGSTVAGPGDIAARAHRIVDFETVYRFGLALGLLGTLCTVPLAVGLYVTVKPVDPNLAVMGLVFRAAEAGIGAVAIVGSFAALDVYRSGGLGASQLQLLRDVADPSAGTSVSAIFFCVGSTIFFYVLSRSSYIPRLMSLLGVFASLVYLAYWLSSLVVTEYPAGLIIGASLPILVAEVSTGLWLLIRGIPEPKGSPALRPA